MRLPRLGLFALLAALAFANLAVTLSRSTIPYALDGRVAHIEKRFEKHPGVDDVYFVFVDGRRLHVDRDVGVQLRVGDEIAKRSWSTQLRTPRGFVDLQPSRDFVGMVPTMLVALGAGGFLLRRDPHA